MVKKPKENAIRNALCVIIAFLSGFMKEWLQQSNRPKRQQNGKKKNKEKKRVRFSWENAEGQVYLQEHQNMFIMASCSGLVSSFLPPSNPRKMKLSKFD